MRKLFAALALTAGLLVGATGAALASPTDPRRPNERASCIGLILADHARGIPDGMTTAEIMQGVRALPGAPGSFISVFSRAHLGSHAVCGAE